MNSEQRYTGFEMVRVPDLEREVQARTLAAMACQDPYPYAHRQHKSVAAAKWSLSRSLWAGTGYRRD